MPPNISTGFVRMIGRVIGHYKIVDKIGSGAMGDVFRARDERLGRDVALKVIRASSSDNADHVRRFELEARAVAALNHPNIVAIYDVGLEEGSPYIVCELLEGKTLRQRLNEGPLTTRQVLDYAQQIVQGLIAAHERRIIHRDLKPENLFATSDGRVKILDFGVAKLQMPDEAGRHAQELTTVTKTGAVIGTVAYMSPEQLRSRAVDHRSDIFSVGGILYEMLTGRRAFRGETEVDTITAVLREDPPELELEHARIPVAFQQIVRHCLEKEPEKRFQSARDLAFALETLPEASGTRRHLSSPKLGTRILPWAVSALLLVATMLLSGKLAQENSGFPSYHRITFDQGPIYSARFAPGFQSVVYGAAWAGKPLALFSTVADSLLAQPLNVKDASLLAVSKTGEMALIIGGAHMQHLVIEKGMLARAPLAGGSPREVLDDVRWADWDSNGELAVVHHVEGGDRIEYPVGHVLYTSAGWISYVRVSPLGDGVAFLNHPALWDDKGMVCFLDRNGKLQTLTQSWESIDGLAWSSTGKEIWFTAAATGYTRELYAVDRKSKTRTVLSIPAGLTLHDIAPDGRVLLSLDAERIAMATETRDGQVEDISWHDWDLAKDISPDGQSVLFEDASEAAPPDYSVALRKLDGTPPILLGEGSAGGLSRDGKWAIGILGGRVTLYPIGPGQPRNIPLSGLDQIQNGSSRFLPNGKQITINGNEPGHGVRSYLVNIDDGKSVPITPEGVTGSYVSPDGRQLLANNGEIFSLQDGTAPRPIPGLDPDFKPLQWSADATAVYGYYGGHIPAKVSRVDVATGHETFIQEIKPQSTVGLVYIAPVVVNRDASRFAFSYYQVFSVLYEVTGLR
jgi:eukaryotic-like serine/threonine-protein kinase